MIESSLDNSDIQAVASYSWNGEKEIVEYSSLTSSDFEKSRYLLDESNLVGQRIRYFENSDSIYFTETYSTQAGRISTWTGSFETASCFYKAEMLDSVYLVNTDHENAEIYSYKFKYDSANRLIQVDEKSIVPNNNPGPDKRSIFQYSSGDSILVKTFSTSEISDTVEKKIVVENGLPTKILSPVNVNGIDRVRIKSFAYPSPTTMFIGKKRAETNPAILNFKIDVLGRKERFTPVRIDFDIGREFRR